MVSLLADVVLDPLIGQLVGPLPVAAGAGAIPSCTPRPCRPAAFFYFLWHAPKGLAAGAHGAWRSCMLIGVRVSVASYEIASTALAPELAPDYNERTTLLGLPLVLRASARIGGHQHRALRGLPAAGRRQPAGRARTAARYAQFGAMAAVVMFVCILVSTAATHSRIRYLHQPPKRRESASAQTFREIALGVHQPGAAGGDGLRRAGRHRRRHHLGARTTTSTCTCGA